MAAQAAAGRAPGERGARSVGRTWGQHVGGGPSLNLEPGADLDAERGPDGSGPHDELHELHQGGDGGQGLPLAQDHLSLVTKALDELAAAGWLNEQRAAEQLVQARAARYGQRRLRQLLSQRAIDSDAAAASLAAVRDTELDRARSVWLKRFGAPASDLREKARQQRFLAARGFESSIIDRVLKEAALGGRRTQPDSDEADPATSRWSSDAGD